MQLDLFKQKPHLCCGSGTVDFDWSWSGSGQNKLLSVWKIAAAGKASTSKRQSRPNRKNPREGAATLRSTVILENGKRFSVLYLLDAINAIKHYVAEKRSTGISLKIFRYRWTNCSISRIRPYRISVIRPNQSRYPAKTRSHHWCDHKRVWISSLDYLCAQCCGDGRNRTFWMEPKPVKIRRFRAITYKLTLFTN